MLTWLPFALLALSALATAADTLGTGMCMLLPWWHGLAAPATATTTALLLQPGQPSVRDCFMCTTVLRFAPYLIFVCIVGLIVSLLATTPGEKYHKCRRGEGQGHRMCLYNHD